MGLTGNITAPGVQAGQFKFTDNGAHPDGALNSSPYVLYEGVGFSYVSGTIKTTMPATPASSGTQLLVGSVANQWAQATISAVNATTTNEFRVFLGDQALNNYISVGLQYGAGGILGVRVVKRVSGTATQVLFAAGSGAVAGTTIGIGWYSGLGANAYVKSPVTGGVIDLAGYTPSFSNKYATFALLSSATGDSITLSKWRATGWNGKTGDIG